MLIAWLDARNGSGSGGSGESIIAEESMISFTNANYSQQHENNGMTDTFTQILWHAAWNFVSMLPPTTNHYVKSLEKNVSLLDLTNFHPSITLLIIVKRSGGGTR